MAEQNTITDPMESAQMETDNLYKELEPDANEIMFGQKTQPARPLTMREASKRKKIIMKLVDQKLKFKLIELMRNQVANKHTKETATTIPTVCQTTILRVSQTAIPTISQTNNSQPSHSFTNYQSQPNWFPYSGLQHAEGNWQQHCQAEWQSSIYPPQYGTAVDTSWNNCSFQPNIQSNVQGNIQHFHQNLNQTKPLKWKFTPNPNLICPEVATNINNVIYKDNKISTNTSMDVQDKPKISAPRSSLISINCNQKSQDRSDVIEPLMKNQLNKNSSTSHLPNVKKATPNRLRQVPVLPLSLNSAAVEKPIKPRRRRRYGRTKELKKQIKASAIPGTTVVLRDKFGIRCVTKASNSVELTDGNTPWNEINQLVTSIFRKNANKMEPLCSYEQKLQYKYLIEMSMNPDTLRSDKVLSQFLNRITIEKIISEAKMILEQVKRSNPQVQNNFTEFRNNVIRDLKAMTDDAVEANVTENLQLIQTKINDVIDCLLCVNVDETKRNKMISQLIANPRTLETSEIITKVTTNKINVMRKIKSILDEHMIVRPGKRFYISIRQKIDVPFLVAVHEKSIKMSDENAAILRDALIEKTESVISQIKPKIIDPKICDGSLVIVCANRKTFDLVKVVVRNEFNGKWTGADLTVTPVQIKNPLARSQLKTVLLKFTEPQFYHFNNLIERLKIDNPRLLVRRWELHEPPPGKLIDSTECIYVGVDIESLGTIEQMNRVAVLLNSTVTFEICYDESERNYLPDHALLTQ